MAYLIGLSFVWSHKVCISVASHSEDKDGTDLLMQQPSSGWTPLIPFGGPIASPKRYIGRGPIGLGSLELFFLF